MTEDHIQWLWNKKLLPFPHLKLTDGSELTVVDTGLHNTAERGPDFSQAKVIYDKLQHYGDVEIHLNSSDWYQHRHDTDKRYNKVILHVVYDNDRQVYIQGKELPTLELKQWFSKSELMVKVGSDFLPKPLCSRGLSSVKRELLRQELLRSIEFKLNKKMEPMCK